MSISGAGKTRVLQPFPKDPAAAYVRRNISSGFQLGCMLRRTDMLSLETQLLSRLLIFSISMRAVYMYICIYVYIVYV